MAEPNAFMAERDRRVAANRKQLAAIGILNAVEGMREAQEAIRAEARRYRSPPRPRPLRGPSRSSGPPRRSGRVAKQPPKRYYDDMALSWPGATPRKRRHVGKSRSSRRGPSDRYAHYGDSYATSQAEDAAEAAATSFAEKCKNLCSVKVMTPSQVSGGFWMNLPYQFYREVGVYTKCTSEFRCGDDECDWEVVWLPHGGGGGLSGQWREFSIRQVGTSLPSIPHAPPLQPFVILF
ncbi:unnamed protein product [Ostreobium quekettii]|uniref:Uncharacterized protein n=1 Tax=Ostreobium quekettii TaxID=121088 RepID=A0A8S1IUY9_9CHLO|nr:unnamed protein product [Ostreobium quekettii]